MTTYKAIAKNNFVRPEEGWRNPCTELRRSGLSPVAPSICSSEKNKTKQTKKQQPSAEKVYIAGGTPSGFTK